MDSLMVPSEILDIYKKRKNLIFKIAVTASNLGTNTLDKILIKGK